MSVVLYYVPPAQLAVGGPEHEPLLPSSSAKLEHAAVQGKLPR